MRQNYAVVVVCVGVVKLAVVQFQKMYRKRFKIKKIFCAIPSMPFYFIATTRSKDKVVSSPASNGKIQD